jgi:hypothetical protein
VSLAPGNAPFLFYVNARKNLFYCHGCGRGGDLIRFVQLSQHLSFRQSLAYLQQRMAAANDSPLLEQTAAFYQLQFHRHAEAVEYLLGRDCTTPPSLKNSASATLPAGVCTAIWRPSAIPSSRCADPG